MLKKQTIDIVCQHGVNQAVDERVLPSGWLKYAYNCRFDRDGRLVKRPGHDDVLNTDGDGNTISGTERKIATRERELVRFNGTVVYSYDDGGRWPVRDLYTPVGAVTRRVANTTQNRPNKSACVASANGYTVYVWREQTTSYYSSEAAGDIVAAIYGPDHNLIARKTLSNTGWSPQAIAVSGYVTITWSDQTSSPSTIYGVTVDTGAAVPAFSSSTSLATDATQSATINGNVSASPIEGSSTHFVIAYRTSATAIMVRRIAASSFTESHNASVTVTSVTDVAVRAWDGESCWVLYTGGGAARYFVRSAADLTSTLAETTIDSSGALMRPAIGRVTATSAAFYWLHQQAGTLSESTVETRFGGGDTSGTATVTRDIPHVIPASHPVTVNSRDYMVFYFPAYDGTLAPGANGDSGLFLVDMASEDPGDRDFTPVAVLGKAYPYDIAVINVQGNPLGRPYVTSGNEIVFAFPEVFEGADTDALVYPDETYVPYENLTQVMSYRCTIEDTKALQFAEYDNAAYFSGGWPTTYDGRNLVESGYAWAPDILEDSPSSTGGNMSDGTYSYIAVYEWIDNLGRTHRSHPSLPYSVTLSGATSTQKVQLAIRTLSLTRRQRAQLTTYTGPKVAVHLYRTTDNGTNYFRVTGSTIAAALNDPEAPDVTITDTLTDADLSDNQLLYTVGGVLENYTPRSASCIAAWDGRIFTAEGDTVYWTKWIANGEAEGWPQVVYNQKFDEPITGLAPMSGSLLVLTQKRLYRLFGSPGPDNLGSGGYGVEPISVSGGCIDPRSVVAYQSGVFYQSERGIELLPHGAVVPQFIGQRVRDELDTYPVITDTAVDTLYGLVEFATVDSDTAPTAGQILVYDYRIGEWLVDDLKDGATPVRSVVFWVGSTSVPRMMLAETAGTVWAGLPDNGPGSIDGAGNPYKQIIQTAPIYINGVQGCVSLYSVIPILSLEDTSLDVTLGIYGTGYDGSTLASDTATWSLSGTKGAQVSREFAPSVQQRQSVRLQLVDYSTANTGYRLHGFSLVLGINPDAKHPLLAASERA